MEYLNMNKKPVLHLLGMFHTIHSNEYSHCAFTGKALRLGTMMTKQGYHVVEYANAGSESHVASKVPILYRTEFDNLKTRNREEDFIGNDAVMWTPLHTTFQDRLIAELKKRVKPGDFILHPFGRAYDVVTEIFPGNIHIETGIGYYKDSGIDSSIKIFESQAIMNYHYGQTGTSPSNYHYVIPNYYNIDEWEVNTEPGEYVAYLGRIDSIKGLGLVKTLSEYIDKKIILCGQGDPSEWVSDKVEYKGPIKGRERSDFLRNAYCTLVPSLYLEPFGGVSIESTLCGTPVLTSDHSVFKETIHNGINGFRNQTLREWIDSYNKVKTLNRETIAKETRMKYSLEAVGKLYDEAFRKIYTLYSEGFYSLKHLTEVYS